MLKIQEQVTLSLISELQQSTVLSFFSGAIDATLLVFAFELVNSVKGLRLYQSEHSALNIRYI